MPNALVDSELILLDKQLCFLMYACSRAMTKAYQPMLTQMGITYPQYLVLMVLWEWHDQQENEPTVKALGLRLQLDSGTLTPLLKRLEKMALVIRRRDHEDERRVMLSITAEGLSLRKVASSWLATSLDTLPVSEPDVVHLRDQLKSLLAALNAHK